MDAKSLKKLNRRELLELMVKISEENEALAQENEVLKAEIENRKLSAKEVGSLAQASLDANNYFAAAENAAKLYLENVARIEQETKARSSQLLEETLTECINMRAAAGFAPDDLIPAGWGAPGAIETQLAQEAQVYAGADAQVAVDAQEVGSVVEETLQDGANADAQGSDANAAVLESAEEAAPAAPVKEKKGFFGRKKK